MKRLLLCFLSVALVFSFCCCDSDSKNKSSDNDTPKVTANPASDFKYHFDGDYTVIDKYVGDDLTVVIPEEIESKPVISIGREAFKSSAITSVAILDSVEIIRTEAFAECDALTDVKFGNSVTYLGEKSFFSCDALEKLKLPRNLVTADNNAVSQCKSLKELTVPKTLNRCYQSPFAKNEALVIINFEEGLEEISGGAFSKCTALETLMIPASVKRIGISAFLNCNALKDVYFAGDKPDVGGDAFLRSNKEEINMHYNAKEKVPTVTLERTAPNTFDSEIRVNPATHFEYFTTDNEYATIIRYISSDDTVIIPETIEGLPVKVIGPSSFFAHDIKTIVFPKSIDEIFGDAFYYCNSLESVTFKGNIPEIIPANTFNSADDDFIIYYDSSTSGWDESPLKDWYTLVEK